MTIDLKTQLEVKSAQYIKDIFYGPIGSSIPSKPIKIILLPYHLIFKIFVLIVIRCFQVICFKTTYAPTLRQAVELIIIATSIQHNGGGDKVGGYFSFL